MRRGVLDKGWEVALEELPPEARPAMRNLVEARSAEWRTKHEPEMAVLRSKGRLDRPRRYTAATQLIGSSGWNE